MRGIRCDVWQTDSDAVSAMNPRPPPPPPPSGAEGRPSTTPGGNGTTAGGGYPGAGGGNSSAMPSGAPFAMNYTLTYYFSSADWSIPEDNASQVPVRVVLKGYSIKSLDFRTMQPIIPPERSDFHHIYDYTSFHVGPPDAVEFAQPCNLECTSTNTTWTTAVKTAILVGEQPCSHNTMGTPNGYGSGGGRSLSTAGTGKADVGLAIALFAAGVFVTLVMQNIVWKSLKGSGGKNAPKYETHTNPSGGDSEL